MKKKTKILLSIVFPGICQVIEGNYSVGFPLLIANGIFFYFIWLTLMPISLALTLQSILAEEREEGSSKKAFEEELQQILKG